MAAIDLTGSAAGSVRQAYAQHLQRAASDEEVQNWLSGAYGHGSADNLQPVLQAIANSDEARQKRPTPTPPTTPTTPVPPVFDYPSPTPRGPTPDPRTVTPAPPPGSGIDQTFWDAITKQYQQSTGRDPLSTDVGKWWSGQYGWGTGMAGLQAMLEAIRTSGEAKDYAARTGGVPPPPGQTRPPSSGPMLPPSGNGDSGGIPGGSPGSLPPSPNGTPAIPGTPTPDFAAKINAAYAQYLNRSATPDEILQWYTGQYGWGAGDAGLPAMLEAIRRSPEALARTNGQVPGTSYFDLDYWRTQGVKPEDIFDPATGQLRPGWTRTGRGYERTGSGTPTTPTPTPGAMPPGGYQGYITGLLGQQPSSPAALAQMEAQLAQYGIRLQKDSAGNVRGRLYLPDGRAIDVVTQWGQPWTWIDRGMASGDGGGRGGWNAPSTGGGGLGGTLPGTQYSDPYTKLLEELIQSRIGQLQQPLADPLRQQYERAMQDRATALGQTEPAFQALLDYLKKRFEDLQGPGYTDAEHEVLRTQTLDPVERDRAAAKQRVLERLAARGITLDSGIAQQALLDVDRAFDSMRAGNQNQLAINELARREDRQNRATTIGGQLVELPQLRANQQMDVFAALAQLGQVARDEDAARAREAIQYSGSLSDLGQNRLQLALQAAGMGGNPSSVLSGLTQIASLNQNQANMNRQSTQNFWSGLGSIIAILAGGK